LLPWPSSVRIRELRVGDDFRLDRRTIYRVTSVSRAYVGARVLRTERVVKAVSRV
jgi:hypothetical protein